VIRRCRALCCAVTGASLALLSQVASAETSTFDGALLSRPWAIPFAGILLSLAIWPLLAPRFWHDHYGKITAAWSIAFLVPFTAVFGIDEAVHTVVHVLVGEYLPFVILLLALYTVAGGIAVRGTLVGTPALNTGIIALGTALASFMGTTGAAMLLIRPLLRANQTRERKVHLVVFFIILVGNVGGALSPLGDPPLFIGFLKGVDFFWTTRALAMPTLLLSVALLATFFVVDTLLWKRDRGAVSAPPPAREPLAVEGAWNFLLVAGVIGLVLLSGIWKPGIAFDLAGTPLELQNLARDVGLLLLVGGSLWLTPRRVRKANAFNWAPIAEVAKLFAGIFLTVAPVIAMLHAGREGALAPIVALVSDASNAPRPLMYLWMTGILSAFLDNAPTYLVFFNLAGGDAATLMGPLGRILAMISAGSVYFGALTYIGNAPNFMVKAIAEERGVAMPSFFPYFAWASLIMAPMLSLLSWIYA